jgi:hypothetical protein
MKTYIAIFTNPGTFLETGELHQFEMNSIDILLGYYNPSESHSCYIFAIDGHFDLNLITKSCSVLENVHSVGVIDEDELSWMLSFDLAA